MIRPDVIDMVDWALTTNDHLSTTLPGTLLPAVGTADTEITPPPPPSPLPTKKSMVYEDTVQRNIPEQIKTHKRLKMNAFFKMCLSVRTLLC